MYKLFFFFIGFILSVFGFTYIIAYLNLLTFGYSFIEYLKFIVTRYECILSIVGVIMIFISTSMKGDIFYDIYL